MCELADGGRGDDGGVFFDKFKGCWELAIPTCNSTTLLGVGDAAGLDIRNKEGDVEDGEMGADTDWGCKCRWDTEECSILGKEDAEDRRWLYDGDKEEGVEPRFVVVITLVLLLLPHLLWCGMLYTLKLALGASPRMMKLWMISVLFSCSGVILGPSMRDFAKVEWVDDNSDDDEEDVVKWWCSCDDWFSLGWEWPFIMIMGSASAESLAPLHTLFLRARNFLWGL